MHRQRQRHPEDVLDTQGTAQEVEIAIENEQKPPSQQPHDQTSPPHQRQYGNGTEGYKHEAPEKVAKTKTCTHKIHVHEETSPHWQKAVHTRLLGRGVLKHEPVPKVNQQHPHQCTIQHMKGCNAWIHAAKAHGQHCTHEQKQSSIIKKSEPQQYLREAVLLEHRMALVLQLLLMDKQPIKRYLR